MLEINCDMGEFTDVNLDLKLLPFVDVVNLATGGHAGSPERITFLIAKARELAKVLTAHFGYADKENFGRIEHDWSSTKILEQLKLQQIQNYTKIIYGVGYELLQSLNIFQKLTL